MFASLGNPCHVCIFGNTLLRWHLKKTTLSLLGQLATFASLGVGFHLWKTLLHLHLLESLLCSGTTLHLHLLAESMLSLHQWDILLRLHLWEILLNLHLLGALVRLHLWDLAPFALHH